MNPPEASATKLIATRRDAPGRGRRPSWDSRSFTGDAIRSSQTFDGSDSCGTRVSSKGFASASRRVRQGSLRCDGRGCSGSRVSSVYADRLQQLWRRFGGHSRCYAHASSAPYGHWAGCRSVAEGRRQWPVLRVGLVAVTRECESAVTGLVAAGRRQRLLIYRGLVHLQRASESKRDRLLTELRQQRVLMYARLVHLRRACGSRLVQSPGGTAAAAARLARAPSPRPADVRVRGCRPCGGGAASVAGLASGSRPVTRECGSALMGLVLAGRRSAGSASRLARLLTELRRQRLVLNARLIHVRLTSRSALVGLVAASRRQWRSWCEHLFRVERAWRSAVAGHVAAGQQLVLRRRVARLAPSPFSQGAGGPTTEERAQAQRLSPSAHRFDRYTRAGPSPLPAGGGRDSRGGRTGSCSCDCTRRDKPPRIEWRDQRDRIRQTPVSRSDRARVLALPRRFDAYRRSAPQPARVEARRATNGEKGTPRAAEGCAADDARFEHRPGSVDPDGADDEHHGGRSSA